MNDLPGLRNSAELDKRHRTLFIDFKTIKVLASTNHWELQTLLNNWFQTKVHNELV